MDEHVDASAGKNEAAQPAPPAVETHHKPPPIENPCRQPSAEEKPEKMSKSDKIMSICTIFIALGTVVSAVAIGLQLREMIKGGLDTKAIAHAAQQQVCAANRFADSADKINAGIGLAVVQLQTQAGKMDKARESEEKNSANNLQSTIDDFHRDQRAWLSAQPAVGVPETAPFDINFPITNSGKTPATHVIVYFSGHYEIVSKEMPTPVSGTPVSLGYIAPNETTIFRFHSNGAAGGQIPIELTPAEANFAVFGAVTYSDVSSGKHWITYCFFKDKTADHYAYCPVHNEVGDGDLPPDALK